MVSPIHGLHHWVDHRLNHPAWEGVVGYKGCLLKSHGLEHLRLCLERPYLMGHDFLGLMRFVLKQAFSFVFLTEILSIK